jgi:hypothetical protein
VTRRWPARLVIMKQHVRSLLVVPSDGVTAILALGAINRSVGQPLVSN